MRLLDPTGFVHLKVSTNNSEAQKYFNQGLTLRYAFNRWDSLRSFKRAAELDPSLAMAWWAIAGATYVEFTGQPDYRTQIKESRDAITRALGLKATPKERTLIEASAKLYSDEEKPDQKALQAAYQAALKAICDKFPNDPDATLAYATTFGWDWSKDGKPFGGTATAVEVLEKALKKNSKHLGLNHIYIHSVEASAQPEKALRSAEYLRSLKLKEPELGHLVHMPAHIYIRTGDFAKAAESNQETARSANVQMNEAFNEWHFSHVFMFLRLSHYMIGNFEKLRETYIAGSEWATPNPSPELKKGRGLNFSSLVLFRRWKDILELEFPEDQRVPTYYYAKAYAYAATGRVADAEMHYRSYLAICRCGPDGELVKQTNPGDSPSTDNLRITVAKLAARIAEAKGDDNAAVDQLRNAVSVEDGIPYAEPPVVTEPVRVNLGGLLLRLKRFAEAEEVFRKDLEHHRGNGRSLFGLMKALEGQNKTKGARAVRRKFEEAWRYADTALTIQEL